jgi:hypothetical protein
VTGRRVDVCVRQKSLSSGGESTSLQLEYLAWGHGGRDAVAYSNSLLQCCLTHVFLPIRVKLLSTIHKLSELRTLYPRLRVEVPLESREHSPDFFGFAKV